MIYEERPDICRIDIQYEKNYSSLYSWENFIALNQKSCDILSQMHPKSSHSQENIIKKIILINTTE